MTDRDFPAFPRQHDKEGHNGMTLRDYFAAKALAPILGASGGYYNEEKLNQYAAIAYVVADAMMKARSE